MTSEYVGADNLELMTGAVNYNRYLLRMVLNQTRDKEDHVLDVGAGNGLFARELAQFDIRVSCVEPDVNQAKTIAAAGLGVFPAIDEIDDLSVDYLYSLNVLEHIQDDLGALQQWQLKIKPGGRMLLYVPAFQSLFSSMDRKVGHYRRYRAKGLAALVAAAGFKVQKVRYVDSAGFIASLIYKLVGSQEGTINRTALLFYDRVIFPLSRLGDIFLSRFVGKNVYVVAIKPANQREEM